MSAQDKYYEEARVMVVHCRYCDRDYKCPDDLEQDRIEVAARLRADAELLSEREKHWNKLYDDQRMSDAEFYSKIIIKRDAENATLQAEGERLKTENERLKAEVGEMKDANRQVKNEARKLGLL